ncbi:MAG: hypothetical protein RLZZ470_229 [Pseudomonadota bacterium]|jgi:methionine-rich copper-binding protein CopC
MQGRRVLVSVCLGLPSLVMAHAHLLDSEPPAHAQITQAPSQVRLRFSEPVEKNFSRIDVQADGQSIALSPSSLQWDASGKVLQIQLPVLGARQYQVTWSILAKDGHPGKGRLGFQVKR